mmetsp:Transcript_20025/g.41099  ORF Transcript_20025/g.41099 Transcript_20025/m.41099 type:complete len:108 (+) Transcript_20025:210-533(+)
MVRIVDGMIVSQEHGGSSPANDDPSTTSGNTVDFLGFKIPRVAAGVGCLFCFLWFGFPGIVFIGLAALAYNRFGTPSTNSQSATTGARRGAQVRTIADLPKPPAKGG